MQERHQQIDEPDRLAIAQYQDLLRRSKLLPQGLAVKNTTNGGK